MPRIDRYQSLEQKKKQAIKEGGLILTLESAVGNTLDGSIDHKDTTNLRKTNEFGKKITQSPQPH